MKRMMKGPSSLLLALSIASVTILSGCGGGSNSASGGGGGSGGTIAGTVDNGLAVNHGLRDHEPVLLAFGEVLVPTAHASGVAGVTVQLIAETGVVVQTTTTDSDGNFIFTGLTPGSYTIRLSQGGSVLGETPSVQVSPNAKTSIALRLDGTMTSVEVEVEAEDDHISGEVETEGADDNASGNDDNEDDNSAQDDNDSEDDHGNRDEGSNGGDSGDD